MLWLAERFADVPGVVAVVLGGSRAEGRQRPDSDWDFGLCYRDTLDPDDIRALGYEGTVFAPGDWAYPMNGGAWLRVDGQKVDLLYRDRRDVERELARSERGEWELYRVPGSPRWDGIVRAGWGAGLGSRTKALLLAGALTVGAVSTFPAAAQQQDQAGRRCTPGYRSCIPNRRSDVDCRGGGGDRPRYTRAGVVYRVRGADRYGLDADNDHRGCE